VLPDDGPAGDLAGADQLHELAHVRLSPVFDGTDGVLIV
jgi:hypothetical protein